MSPATPFSFGTGVAHLLARCGIDHEPAALRMIGADPVVASPLCYASATASALAAHGAGIAAIWRERGGRPQSVEVDARRAVWHGLRSMFELRQSGRPVLPAGFASKPSAGYHRTRDGRHAYVARLPDNPGAMLPMSRLFDGARSSAEISKAVASWDADALEEAAAVAKVACAVARTETEWARHPQGELLHRAQALQVQRIADSEPRPLGLASRPLEGLRVLDCSHVIAGPTLGRLLAEQGAQVLQVSAPQYQDPQPVVIDTGFGKRHAHLDLTQARELALLKTLIQDADVFIESWRPGAMDRKGLSAVEVAQLKPGIVYASISCYGAEGPWATRGGYEQLGQAVSGLAFAEGGGIEPRNAPTGTMNDYLAAYLAGCGVVGALLQRARSGGSYHVTTSLTQASMWVLAFGRADATMAAVAPGPLPLKTTTSPYGELQHAPPVIDYSETPGAWSRPPEPPGASPAAWL